MKQIINTSNKYATVKKLSEEHYEVWQCEELMGTFFNSINPERAGEEAYDYCRTLNLSKKD